MNKKECHLNTRLGTDHHQLIMLPISMDCSSTFLERSFIYAAPMEWTKLSKHIRTSNFDCFRESVKKYYLHNRAPPTTLNKSIPRLQTLPNILKQIVSQTKFTNNVKHAIQKTNRSINRATQNIQGYNITLTTIQVQETIKQSKNNISQGPDKLNIRQLKHMGTLGLAFLMSMFKNALNKNIIPHTWKLANIVPIPKPNKDTDKGIFYRPLSLLSVIAKTLEKSLLP